MVFDDLNQNDKKRIWDELYKLADYYDQVDYKMNELESKIKELEKTADTSGCIGFTIVAWIVTMVFYIGGVATLCEADGLIGKAYNNYPLQVTVVSFALAVVLSVIIWSITLHLSGYFDGKKAKKQIVLFQDNIKTLKDKMKNINMIIQKECTKYSIPIEVINLTGMKYVREFVSDNKCCYAEAFSSFVKKWDKMSPREKRSMSAFSGVRKYSRRNLVHKSANNPSLATLPFKFMGAFLGIDKETINEEMKRKYNTSDKTRSSSSSGLLNNMNYLDESSLSSFTFKDSKGNLCESGGLFYDGKGNLCDWGGTFYDGKGNLCQWGTPFYDGKGNYCDGSSPFYDWQGNLIDPQ